MGASYARNGSNHHKLLVGLRRSFAREEVLAVAQKAMEILWADSSLEGFDVRIEPAQCDYHVVAIRKGTEAAEDIFFSIDRSSRVNSAPECWWLGELGNCPTED